MLRLALISAIAVLGVAVYAMGNATKTSGGCDCCPICIEQGCGACPGCAAGNCPMCGDCAACCNAK